MATKELFSADTTGEPIIVTSTASTGTLIHTNADAVRDEVYAWATNSHTAAEVLNFTFGETATKDLITINIPAGETVQIIDGLRMGTAGEFRAWAETTANTFRIAGYYNRLV